MEGRVLFHLGGVDYLIVIAYFAIVLVVGYVLKRFMRTGLDFFLAGRSMPGWVAGLAFLSANLGALEILGMAANSYQHGIQTVHFYWVGAIPAMLFLALFMMPFYYRSRARSVPEYLSLRYNEATRALNAISFAVMTLVMSGISMYSMAVIFRVLLGWNLHFSILLSALVVLIYVFLGGLTSAIFNEVIQFFLIWLGLLPLSFLCLKAAGGWGGIVSRVHEALSVQAKITGKIVPADGHIHAWLSLLDPSRNSMGIDWLGTVLGLGFVLSFGYWCTDFLVVQRAFAAESLPAAQMAPVFASFFKMAVPLLVVVPGLAALVLVPDLIDPTKYPFETPRNYALPVMMAKFYPPGLAGLGLTALLASFMSGMAGNVTAFNTVWTYDIYESYIVKDAPDEHYLKVGRYTTVFGVLASIGAAYLCLGFKTIMDFMQMVFSCVNAPLFATFLLGMFWRRATGPGGFWGLLSGIASALAMFFVSDLNARFHFMSASNVLYKLHILMPDARAMAANFWRAWWAWLVCFAVTIVVSLLTRPEPEEKLRGLCWMKGERLLPVGVALVKNPVFWAAISFGVFVALDIIFA